jgi:hypothetical protein
MRSLTGITAMDVQDELVQQQINVSGLSDVLTSMQQRIAAATGIPAIPATLLFGKSPDGMNATGDSDIRLYYDQIKAEQTSKLVPALDRIYTLLLSEKSGPTKGSLPDKWTYDFNSLWLQTDKEKAEIRYIMAQADALYNTGQVISPEEIATSRFKNGFSVDTVLDSGYREALTAIQKSEQTTQPADLQSTTATTQEPVSKEVAAAVNISEILTSSDAASVFTVNQILKMANQPPIDNGEISVYEHKALIDARIEKLKQANQPAGDVNATTEPQ